ncbi:hypothetical protein Q6D67_11395 [Haliea sp. E1-2-M8]|uniref:hypothetical protein n=1 Tax=Haliea sp. E1-2-M8 TaxID=3064706 RepID=UPI0027165E7E|nr:hypothetical protein [Haliea sp. E1-2-M8]MDO8862307.1 hypothetical protein [Haliea sp. E1-2-M8]
MNYFYHYTTGEKLPLILEAGYLKPSAAGGSPGEQPLLWLSRARDYEPTALKLLQLPGGRARLLSQVEQREVVGNVRFRLKADTVDLLPWRDACRAAGICRRERQHMERAGKAEGAKHTNWFAVAKTMPVTMFDIEVETVHGWEAMDEVIELEGAV